MYKEWRAVTYELSRRRFSPRWSWRCYGARRPRRCGPWRGRGGRTCGREASGGGFLYLTSLLLTHAIRDSTRVPTVPLVPGARLITWKQWGAVPSEAIRIPGHARHAAMHQLTMPCQKAASAGVTEMTMMTARHLVRTRCTRPQWRFCSPMDPASLRVRSNGAGNTAAIHT